MSTIRVHVKEEVSKLAGFKKETNRLHAEWYNLSLSPEGTCFYFELNSREIPAEIIEADLVTHVTIYDGIPKIPNRERGIYRINETTEATLDYNNQGKQNEGYRIEVQAKTLEEARAILLQIKAGTIRPAESFEQEQGGKSVEELKRDLDAIRADVEKLSEFISETLHEKRELQVKKAELENTLELIKIFLFKLKIDHWVFCIKSHVAEKIQNIIKNNEDEGLEKIYDERLDYILSCGR